MSIHDAWRVGESITDFISLMLRRAVKDLTPEYCLQCGGCTGACPVSRIIEDFNPRQIIARVQLGRIRGLLKTDTIWTCASCLKCKERCPSDISPYDLILILRNLAVRMGYDFPDGYKDLVKSVFETGIEQQPQRVRTRTGKRYDRKSLGLPSLQRPLDMEKFAEALGKLVKKEELLG